MVPKGWKLKQISDLGKVITGSTPATQNAEYYNGKIPFASPGDLGSSKFIISTTKTLTPAGLLKTRSIRKGSTLFTCIGSTIGKIGLAGIDLATNQQINSVVPNELHDDEFVFYALDHRAENIANLAGTQAVPIINKSTFEAQTILVAPLPEQKKIAQILSTWDQAIATTEQLLANSQQQKKALMQQLLTGKKRLLDKNGVRFSGEWKSYELGEWIREYNEKSVSSDQHEVLTSSRGGLVKQSEYFADSRISQRDNIGFNVIPSGYITYRSRSDDGQFFFNRNELSFTGIISTYYPVFHFPEGDSTFFLNYLNRSSSAFAGYSVGTSQKVLSLNVLKAIKARLPKKEEQQKIATVLSCADQEITALQQKLDALKQEKKALMQQLLTGKRRVLVS